MVRKLVPIAALLAAGVAVAATTAPVAPMPSVARCTERGALTLWNEADRRHGVLGSLAVSGSEAALVATDGHGGTVWSGSLAQLGGDDIPAVDAAAVAAAYAKLGKLKARGPHVKGKGVKATVDAEGLLRGTWRGDRAAWALGFGDDGVFGGTVPPDALLARLPRRLKADDPFRGHEADPTRALARVVVDHAARVGVLVACGAGGDTRFLLGRWREPIPVAPGRRVAWSTGDEALVRGPEGAAWYYVVAMGGGQAAELAGELANTRGARVAWEDGLAAILITSDPGQTLPGSPVTPSMPTVPMLALLHPDPGALRPEVGPRREGPLALPGLDPGVEMVRRVNTLRGAAGLAPVELSEPLTWASLGHCAWMDANPGLDPATEAPRTALFLGETAHDRGGADEVVSRSVGTAPAAAVDGWLASPFARALLFHPGAARAGACATPGGARVLDLSMARKGAGWETRSYPTDGMTAVPRSYGGGDPVLRQVANGADGPFGFPVTLWVNTPAVGFQVLASQLLDPEGNRVDHLLVRGTEAPGGMAAADASVHVVARAPLRAGVAYAWEIDYTAAGKPGVGRGRFQTAMDPGAAPMPLDALGARVVALLNTKRGNNASPLVPTVSATQGARLVAATRRNDGVDRMLPLGSAWYCASTSWFQGWLAKGEDGFDVNLDPIGTDARYGQVGAATPRGDLCLLFSREGGRTPR